MAPCYHAKSTAMAIATAWVMLIALVLVMAITTDIAMAVAMVFQTTLNKPNPYESLIGPLQGAGKALVILDNFE